MFMLFINFIRSVFSPFFVIWFSVHLFCSFDFQSHLYIPMFSKKVIERAILSENIKWVFYITHFLYTYYSWFIDVIYFYFIFNSFTSLCCFLEFLFILIFFLLGFWVTNELLARIICSIFIFICSINKSLKF